jgi:hypothetical protein
MNWRVSQTGETGCALNNNDLDEVMSFLANDAGYHPDDGAVWRGKAEIRDASAPQF